MDVASTGNQQNLFSILDSRIPAQFQDLLASGPSMGVGVTGGRGGGFLDELLRFRLQEDGSYRNDAGNATLAFHGENRFTAELNLDGRRGPIAYEGLRVGSSLVFHDPKGGFFLAETRSAAGGEGLLVGDLRELPVAAVEYDSEDSVNVRYFSQAGIFASADGRVQGEVEPETGRFTGVIRDEHGNEFSFEGLVGEDDALVALDDGRLLAFQVSKESDGSFTMHGFEQVLREGSESRLGASSQAVGPANGSLPQPEQGTAPLSARAFAQAARWTALQGFLDQLLGSRPGGGDMIDTLA